VPADTALPWTLRDELALHYIVRQE
jgi:hypothetical protein